MVGVFHRYLFGQSSFRMLVDYMDNGFRGSGPDANFTLSCTLGAQRNVQSWNGFSTDTTLRLESPGSSDVYDSNSNGTKRKWENIHGTEDHESASLAFAFGHSLRSLDSNKRSLETLCTSSSAKETGEAGSMDPNLNFLLHLGGDSMPSAKNPSAIAPKTYRTGLDLDLHLSSSVGLSKSSVTGVTTAPSQHESISEKSVAVSQGLTVDNVSRSAFWKCDSNLSPSVVTGVTEASSQHGSILEKSVAMSQGPIVSNVSSSAFRRYESNLSPCVTTLETRTKANPDQSSSKTETLSSPVTSSSRMVVQRQKHNSTSKNCEVPGCLKGARGASGLCIAHGGGRRCQKAGCHKGAKGKTIYCKAHGGGRRCQQLGCTKSAEGRADFCIAHGGGLRCSHEGCSRAARGKSGLCIRHGGGKRCQEESCTKSAEGYSGLCISHGEGRRCQYPSCTKGAQGSTMLCKAHGGGKRCTFPECKKGAEGSTPFCKGHGGGKRCTFQGGCTKSVHGGTQFCVAHGGGKRCVVPDCTKSARGRTSFCVRHGGGKRCKSAGCDKSAQGSTDFCKAHGGGVKKCTWGQLGLELGLGFSPCYRLASRRTGLCTAHGALVQDERIHGGATLGPLENPQSQTPEKSLQSSLREGRVHGGNLMAMLASSSSNNVVQ